MRDDGAASERSARDDDDQEESSASAYTATSSSAALEWTMTGATAQTILTITTTDEMPSMLVIGSPLDNNKEVRYLDDEDEPSLLSNNTHDDEYENKEAATDADAPTENRKLAATSPRDDNEMFFFNNHDTDSSGSISDSCSSAPVVAWMEHLLPPTSSKQQHHTSNANNRVRGNGCAGGAVKARIERWEQHQQRMHQQKRSQRHKTTDGASIPGMIAVTASFYQQQDRMSYPVENRSPAEDMQNDPSDQELYNKSTCQQQQQGRNESEAAPNTSTWDDGLSGFLNPVNQPGKSLPQGQRDSEKVAKKEVEFDIGQLPTEEKSEFMLLGKEQEQKDYVPNKNLEDTATEIPDVMGATSGQSEGDNTAKQSLPSTIWRPLSNGGYDDNENDDVERQRRLVNERSTTHSSSNLTANTSKGDSITADLQPARRRRQALRIFLFFTLMAIFGGVIAGAVHQKRHRQHTSPVEIEPVAPSASPSTAEPTGIWRNSFCQDAMQVQLNAESSASVSEFWFDELKSAMPDNGISIDCLRTERPTSETSTSDVQGRWYTLLGSGLTVTVKFCAGSGLIAKPLILTGRCGALECITQDLKRTVHTNVTSSCSVLEDLVFATDLNVPYWIFVYTTENTTNIENDDLLSYGLSVSHNDVCSGALVIDIKDTGKTLLNGSTGSAMIDHTVISCESSGASVMLGVTSGVWFFLQGAGTIVSLDTCEDSTVAGALSIYKGDDCSQIECVPASLVQYNSCGASWFAEESVTYYVLLQTTGTFTLTATETDLVTIMPSLPSENQPLSTGDCALEITISCIALSTGEDCSTFRLDQGNQSNDFTDNDSVSVKADASIFVTVTLPENSQSAASIQNLTAVTNYAGPNGLDFSDKLNGTMLGPGQSSITEIKGTFDAMRAYTSIFSAVAKTTNGETCDGIKSYTFTIGQNISTASPMQTLAPTPTPGETSPCAISAVLSCDGCTGVKPTIVSCTYSYPKALWFGWTGRPCNESTSGDRRFMCEDLNITALQQDNLWIIVEDSASGNPIFVGHRFSLFNPVRFDLRNDTISTKSIKIKIVEPSSQGGIETITNGNTIQTMEFGINCGNSKKDVSLLTHYGALQLVGFESTMQGTQRIYDNPTFQLTVLNGGESPADITNVTINIPELEYQGRDILVGKRLSVRDRDTAGVLPYLLHYEANLITMPAAQPLITRIEAVNPFSGLPCSANTVLVLPY